MYREESFHCFEIASLFLKGTAPDSAVPVNLRRAETDGGVAGACKEKAKKGQLGGGLKNHYCSLPENVTF